MCVRHRGSSFDSNFTQSGAIRRNAGASIGLQKVASCCGSFNIVVFFKSTHGFLLSLKAENNQKVIQIKDFAVYLFNLKQEGLLH